MRDIIYPENKWDLLLTEAENWDLLADCTSQDGGEILDAGVHLSDKRTMSLFITLERSERRQDKVESILEII
jgi:hypothetical protein